MNDETTKMLRDLADDMVATAKQIRQVAKADQTEEDREAAAAALFHGIVTRLTSKYSEPKMSDDERMMREQIAKTMGELGIDEIRFGDDEGNDYGGINTKDPLNPDP